ncbi:MAG: SAM-dependent chlorinase/fluorinase [Solirubrobacteraceae bacterium]
MPVITFLSDYGYRDEFVGVCHSVMARRCPAARIIDITHGIARHDVRAGALTLRAALPFTPVGVHLAVIDPGVGTERRAIALVARDEPRFLVGPDNGLLLAAAAAFGGALDAFDIGASGEALTPISATFHGRDIFAPVAAALADGVALSSLGEPIDPEGLVTLPRLEGAGSGKRSRKPRGEGSAAGVASHDGDAPGEAVSHPYTLVARVLSIDGYGNVALNATGQVFVQGADPGAPVVVEIAGERREVAVGATFADVAEGELVVYVDSRGQLALAVNGGSAAERLAVAVDDMAKLHFR